LSRPTKAAGSSIRAVSVRSLHHYDRIGTKQDWIDIQAEATAINREFLAASRATT